MYRNIILVLLILLSGCKHPVSRVKNMQDMPSYDMQDIVHDENHNHYKSHSKSSKAKPYSSSMGNILLNKNLDAYNSKTPDAIYREFNTVKHQEPMLEIEPEIQELELIIPKPEIKDHELISINTSEATPIKDILIEISRKAKLDTNIDSEIDERIILNLQDKTIMEIMEVISKHSNIVYHLDNGTLYVHNDRPTVRNYVMDFINVIRSTKSEMNIDTKVISGESSGFSSGSLSRITASFEGDLWNALESGLKSILARNGTNDNEFYSINKQAGVITVTATQRTHQDVLQYIEKVRSITSSQVLIEAKIIEIALNNTFRAGVDWSLLYDREEDESNFMSSHFDNSFSDIATDNRSIINISTDFGISSLSAAVNLLEKFGVTRTISSPRILAINNQQAVLTFAKNHVYFVVDIDENDRTSDDSTTRNFSIKSNLKSVPIGVILAIQPSINALKNEITMSIRPTLSRVSGGIKDPGTEYTASQASGLSHLTSEIPIVEVRELDSMLKIKSGHIMVIGGLIENKEINEDHGIPILSRIPILGNLFKSTKRSNVVTETVIFIKATIIPSGGDGSFTGLDKELYYQGHMELQ